MNIAVIGSREFPQLSLVADYVKGLPQGTVVISGGALGVDRVAATAARVAKLAVREFLPDWDRHGKSAGFKRNAEIVSAADRLVAFWDGKSRGTADTIEKARQADLTITVINPDGSRYEPEPIDPDSFDDSDPQDGATRDNADDFTLSHSENEGKPKVKLLTTAVRWICAAKPKTRTTKNGRTLDYFTQALFTSRGNRVILTYDAGTHPMKEGAGCGIVVDIFGRDIEKHANDDKTETAIIFGAEVITRSAAERKVPVTVPPGKPTTPEKPKPTEVERTRARYLAKLRAGHDRLANDLTYDDRDELVRRGQLEELGMRIYYVERGIAPVPAGVVPEASELRMLIHEQIADRFGCAGEEIDKDVNDADENTAVDILDADSDGAEISRATEPWADASTPIGATVDADCWNCPCRIGASCSRAPDACILA